MKFKDLALRALGNLHRNKSRTILTSLSVGVGAVTLILTLGLSTAVNTLVNSELSSSVENVELYITKERPSQATADEGVRIYNPDETLGLDEFSGEQVTVELLTQEDISRIRAIEGVSQINPDYPVAVEYAYALNNPDIKISVDSIAHSIANTKVAYGDLPSPQSWAQNDVVISNGYVKALGVESGQALVGSTLTLAYIDNQTNLVEINVNVIGVMQKQTGFDGNDTSGSILASPTLIKTIYDDSQAGDTNYGKFGVATVVIEDVADEPTAKSAIENSGDYEVTSLSDIIKQIASTLDIIKYGLLGFGGIALLAAVFGIVNTQLMSVYERTKEVGLFKALGMSDKAVGGIFSLEATWVGIIGAGFGIGLGYATQIFINTTFGERLTAFNGTIISIQPLDALYVLIGLAVLSFVAGVLPSRKASRLDPIEALRDE
jgi:putative ABC transport system permease protein